MKAALIQLNASEHMADNLAIAEDYILKAAGMGAQLVALPENAQRMCFGRKAIFAGAFSMAEHPALPLYARLAKQCGIWLMGGSLTIKLGDEICANRAVLFAPTGELVAQYDKIHMFDVDLPNGESYRESAAFMAGNKAVLADCGGFKLGLTICYDLRFPKLFSSLALAGADIITVPAAFTVPTGQAHWHVLLRARAIETGCYILAPAQMGQHQMRQTYGHSLVVSPWGEVLLDAGQNLGVHLVDLDLSKVAEARRAIPQLLHAQDFAAPLKT